MSSGIPGAHGCPMDKACGRMHCAGGAHDNEDGAAIDLSRDARHFERNFAEPDNVRAQTGTAAAARDFGHGIVTFTILYYARAAVRFATRLEKLSVHVDHVAGAAAFMQIIHILGAEKQAAADFLLQLSERIVGRVGMAGEAFYSALRIELPDEFRVRIQASGVATVSTLCPAHSPSLSRKVFSPLSALMPAPVRTATRSSGWISMVACIVI